MVNREGRKLVSNLCQTIGSIPVEEKRRERRKLSRDALERKSAAQPKKGERDI